MRMELTSALVGSGENLSTVHTQNNPVGAAVHTKAARLEPFLLMLPYSTPTTCPLSQKNFHRTIGVQLTQRPLIFLSHIHFTVVMQPITESVNLKEMQHKYCES